jgi:hypothetical protein
VRDVEVEDLFLLRAPILGLEMSKFKKILEIFLVYKGISVVLGNENILFFN